MRLLSQRPERCASTNFATSAANILWAREDLNLHGLPHSLLKAARLPISPPAQIEVTIEVVFYN